MPDRPRLSPRSFSQPAGVLSGTHQPLSDLLYPTGSGEAQHPDPVLIVETADGYPTDRGAALAAYSHGRTPAPAVAANFEAPFAPHEPEGRSFPNPDDFTLLTAKRDVSFKVGVESEGMPTYPSAMVQKRAIASDVPTSSEKIPTGDGPVPSETVSQLIRNNTLRENSFHKSHEGSGKITTHL